MRLMKMAHGCAQKVNAKAVAIGTVALAAVGANAQATIPLLDPVAPVVDIDSVTSEVGSFGGTILLAWAGLFIAFGLSYKLVRRLRGTA